jgi:hypothetical protein
MNNKMKENTEVILRLIEQYYLQVRQSEDQHAMFLAGVAILCEIRSLLAIAIKIKSG